MIPRTCERKCAASLREFLLAAAGALVSALESSGVTVGTARGDGATRGRAPFETLARCEGSARWHHLLAVQP